MAKISVVFCLIILAAFYEFANGSAVKQDVGIYELMKGNFSVKLTNWGATIVSVLLPDRNGKLADIALGYDSVKEYMNDTSYVGSIVGRVANRIGGAQFTLNGKHYKLAANEGKNILHGGPKGFSDVAWKVAKYQKGGRAPCIVFTHFSPDGDQGFPGDVLVSVSYILISDKQLGVIMTAKALNKATPVNLAQHSYWNLGGHNSGNILSQKIKIFASHYTPVDSQVIPTGEIVPVKGTPYDFLKPRTVGSRIEKIAPGYDINYVLDGGVDKLKRAAIVYDKKSGRVMELLTNAPGMQFYTANFLQNVKGKGGFVYQPHAALCLETQGFPDAVNHPNFPSVIVTPGKPYKHVMLFKFSAKKLLF